MTPHSLAVAHVLCGPSLAGKSTVAERIAQATGAAIPADAVNAERGLPFGAEGQPDPVWAETLRILLDRLHAHAREGRAVVVDDAQCCRWPRDRYRRRAESVRFGRTWVPASCLASLAFVVVLGRGLQFSPGSSG